MSTALHDMGIVWDSKTKNDKGIPMFLLNIFIVYEKLKILCANIWGFTLHWNTTQPGKIEISQVDNRNRTH